MEVYLKGVAVQGTAILLAALGAALFAFLSSVASTTGMCESPMANPAEVGVIGGLLKAAHTSLMTSRGIV